MPFVRHNFCKKIDCIVEYASVRIKTSSIIDKCILLKSNHIKLFFPVNIELTNILFSDLHEV